jgi:hypothetical protein
LINIAALEAPGVVAGLNDIEVVGQAIELCGGYSGVQMFRDGNRLNAVGNAATIWQYPFIGPKARLTTI